MRLRSFLPVALALVSAAMAVPGPAQAQFWGFGYEPPARRAAPSRGFFSFPFFERGYRSPYGPYGAPSAVDSSRAPPPRKLETEPTRTVLVIGDSMADWLAYGLEEVYSDRPDIGVVRKIRPNSGLIHYEPRNDTLEWSQAVKEILAAEKPSAIVVMLGLNDRVPLRNPAPPREPAPRKGEPPAQPGNAAKEAQQAKQEPPQQAAEPAAQAPAAANNEGPEPGAEALRPGGMYEFHSAPWAQLYRKRIDDMIAALKAKGVPVFWVGLPAIRGPRSTADMGYLDDLYHAAADKAGVHYVDVWDGFVDENGRYSVQGPDFEGQIRRLRTGDGVHFTKFGALKLAHLVDQDLGRVLTNNPALPMPLPGPEAAVPAKPGAARPAIGPVLPLAATGSGQAGDLLGAKEPGSAAGNPLAASVLVRGDALPAPPGRADDFSWPPRGAAANPAPALVPAPASAAPAH